MVLGKMVEEHIKAKVAKAEALGSKNSI